MELPPTLILLIILGVGLMLLLAFSFIMFFTFSQSKLRKEQLKAEQEKLVHQRELLNSTILVQEQERARIAKDLHDEVGSKLNVMHLFLHQLTRQAPEAKDRIGDVLTVIGETIQTTRRISHDLLPPTLEKFGLATALAEFSEPLQQGNEMSILCETEGERPAQFDPIVELNLFRIVQELLQNTLKYAQASEVRIHLRYHADQLTLRYRDDGIGFDPQASPNQKGLGLQNLESRLQMIQGGWHLQSQPGQGMQVRIDVPLGEWG